MNLSKWLDLSGQEYLPSLGSTDDRAAQRVIRPPGVGISTLFVTTPAKS